MYIHLSLPTDLTIVEAIRIGPYRLEDRLGAGGMGVVYRACDERLNRAVAVKLLHPGGSEDHRARFRREARASARLRHPGIVRVLDFVQEGDTEAIVMELVEGRTLAENLQEDRIEPARALSIVRQVTDALAAAHEQGIIHRDLKTENVLVTPAGWAKILDFGIARGSEGHSQALTRDGDVLGTPRAMAPEQARGRKADARSDLFSLGVLMYEVFTGVSPFRADSALATLQRVLTYLQPPALSLAPLPRELSALIDRLLAKAPDQRPRCARTVASALETINPYTMAPEHDKPQDDVPTLADSHLPEAEADASSSA